MKDARKAGIGVLLGVLLVTCWAVPAQASDSCGVREAVKRERAAHRALVRAQADYRTARYVARSTRTLTAQYGKNVGRWVWLAADAGWPRGTWGYLCYIIDRESGGSPGAKNPASTASGLLQFLAFHWDGTGDYGWRFDPFNPRDSLRYGYKLYRRASWSPWSL